MQCTSCQLHSIRLREYSCVADLDGNRKTIATVHLCPICRLLGFLRPARQFAASGHANRRNGFARVQRA